MHPSELYQASPPRVQVLSVPQSSCTGVPQGAYTDCSQQGLLGTTWVPAAKQVNKNKHKSINMAQSAKRRTPDGHMIRPDMTVGSTEEKTNPRKSEMQGPPSAQGSQGLRRHTARLAWPWLPQRDTHALVPAHPHSHPGTEATHTGAPGHVTQTKAGHCPRLTLHKTAMGQQPVGKLQKSCLPILTVTKGHAHRSSLAT